jgi:hypothetical protein
MEINIPIKIEIELDKFLEETNLQNQETIDKLEIIAYGELPQLDEYLKEFLKGNQNMIIELIRVNMAYEIGKGYLK